MGLLRTLLALSVVFAHSPWNQGVVFVGGEHAVQLFYGVSGFLIAHVIRTNPAYRDPLRFYANRFLRLYPVYWAVATMALAAALLASKTFVQVYRDAPPAADALLVLSNLFIVGQDWVMFSGVFDGQLAFAANFRESELPLYRGLLIPPAWTLGVELCFYALAPFILRHHRVLLGLLVLSLAIKLGLHRSGLGALDPWSHRFFPAELCLFLLGALANQHLLPRWELVLATLRWPHAPAIAVALLCGAIATYFLVPVADGLKYPLLLALFLAGLPLALLYQNGSALDRAIGQLSYPIYIGHMLVATVLAKALAAAGWQWSDARVSAANAGVAVLFAIVLHLGIARPFDAWRAAIRQAGPARAARLGSSPPLRTAS